MGVRRAGELVTAAEQMRAAMLRREPVDALALIHLDNSESHFADDRVWTARKGKRRRRMPRILRPRALRCRKGAAARQKVFPETRARSSSEKAGFAKDKSASECLAGEVT
jgi:hypothetical protein